MTSRGRNADGGAKVVIWSLLSQSVAESIWSVSWHVIYAVRLTDGAM